MYLKTKKTVLTLYVIDMLSDYVAIGILIEIELLLIQFVTRTTPILYTRCFNVYIEDTNLLEEQNFDII